MPKLGSWTLYTYDLSFAGNSHLTRIIKMDATKYSNLVHYLRDKEYPEGASKHEKGVLRRLSKQFTFDVQSGSLFYVDRGNDGLTFNRMVIQEEEKTRVFDECHSSPFAGHAGRDNTIQKIKERYYWPSYYKDTVELVSLIKCIDVEALVLNNI